MNVGWIITEDGLRWMERGIQPEDFIGFVSLMLDPSLPQKAAEQLDAGYAHGGGWQPMPGFGMDPETQALTYPGDPALRPLAYADINDERVLCYPHAFFAVVQKDGTFEAARMD